MKTHFVVLPELDHRVAEKLAGHSYYYEISGIKVAIGDKIEKGGQVVGEFKVFVENSPQSYWKSDIISRKAGTVKRIRVAIKSRVKPM